MGDEQRVWSDKNMGAWHTRQPRKGYGNSVLVLKYVDSKYLCYHYIDHICKNKWLEKAYIESLSELNNKDNLFEEESKYLYILDVEKLTEDVDPELKNVVIVCKSLPDNLQVDYIDITKLISWQIEDYVKMRLPGLDEKELKWLCEVCKYDIYRLDNECSKLEMFAPAGQQMMFKEINQENGYVDLNPLTIFNFTNALLKKDYDSLRLILSDLENIDVEATGVVTIMIKQLKNIIDVQLNPKNTAATLGMNPKQFNAIKYNVGKFKDTQLVNMFEFLTDVDYRLKSGELTLDETNDMLTRNNKLVDYITINLLNLSR